MTRVSQTAVNPASGTRSIDRFGTAGSGDVMITRVWRGQLDALRANLAVVGQAREIAER
jgi:hypothetical protein